MTARIMIVVGAALALASILQEAQAQSTVTLTPSVTAGDGQLVTDVSWSTNPALPTGMPCIAGSDPAHPDWSGPKAGSGSQAGLVFTQNTRLTLSCTFQGDSIVTFRWTNPTQNTDGTPYTNPDITRIKYTFNPQLGTDDPAVDAPGDLHVDSPHPNTMVTVTGISQTGTLRARGYARNAAGAWSAPSNAAQKVFTGSVTVNQGVDLTIRSIPNTIGVLEAL